MAAFPSDIARSGRDLLSTDLARSGGNSVTPRSLRLALFVLIVFTRPVCGQTGGELHFCLHGEPKTFNPILVDDEDSENIRYLTGGVLIRLNRQSQALEPGLATSWHLSKDGRRITLQLH